MRCKRCGAEAAFYKSITTCCKNCWRANVQANRRANVDHYREYDRARNASPERREAFAEKQRRKRAEMGPGYVRAHNMVARWIAKGRLVRPKACARCAAACRPHAHHDDHSKPLTVMWLCPECHAARHGELGRLT